MEANVHGGGDVACNGHFTPEHVLGEDIEHRGARFRVSSHCSYTE